MNEQATLFPVPWEPYAWVWWRVAGKACLFPIARWSKPLKQIEVQAGKLKAIKAWFLYLSNTNPRFVSAQSFANKAGFWLGAVPDVPDHHFQSEEAVDKYIGGLERVIDNQAKT